MPLAGDGTLAPVEALQQLRRKSSHSAMYSGVVDLPGEASAAQLPRNLAASCMAGPSTFGQLLEQIRAEECSLPSATAANTMKDSAGGELLD
ncbi:hypothetical protein [Mesorhizobium sp. ES1-3]|uniref:hypothetical protein n=1 Tax=Mesorhizobium sp. ES1-3 TaxID=2876628 RepID=UPI001CCA1CF3|nr:hypothetical protein [Mesorhizobium sp. ES1-3]